MLILKSMTLFIAAGLCEIGGGYLIWLWLREGRSQLVCHSRCNHFNILWYRTDVSAGPFRAGICRLWWHFRCFVYFLGVENRPRPAGPFRSDRRACLLGRRLYNYVLAQRKRSGMIEERILTM